MNYEKEQHSLLKFRASSYDICTRGERGAIFAKRMPCSEHRKEECPAVWICICCPQLKLLVNITWHSWQWKPVCLRSCLSMLTILSVVHGNSRQKRKQPCMETSDWHWSGDPDGMEPAKLHGTQQEDLSVSSCNPTDGECTLSGWGGLPCPAMNAIAVHYRTNIQISCAKCKMMQHIPRNI